MMEIIHMGRQTSPGSTSLGTGHAGQATAKGGFRDILSQTSRKAAGTATSAPARRSASVRVSSKPQRRGQEPGPNHRPLRRAAATPKYPDRATSDRHRVSARIAEKVSATRAKALMTRAGLLGIAGLGDPRSLNRPPEPSRSGPEPTLPRRPTQRTDPSAPGEPTLFGATKNKDSRSQRSAVGLEAGSEVVDRPATGQAVAAGVSTSSGKTRVTPPSGETRPKPLLGIAQESQAGPNAGHQAAEVEPDQAQAVVPARLAQASRSQARETKVFAATKRVVRATGAATTHPNADRSAGIVAKPGSGATPGPKSPSAVALGLADPIAGLRPSVGPASVQGTDAVPSASKATGVALVETSSSKRSSSTRVGAASAPHLVTVKAPSPATARGSKPSQGMVIATDPSLSGKEEDARAVGSSSSSPKAAAAEDTEAQGPMWTVTQASASEDGQATSWAVRPPPMDQTGPFTVEIGQKGGDLTTTLRLSQDPSGAALSTAADVHQLAQDLVQKGNPTAVEVRVYVNQDFHAQSGFAKSQGGPGQNPFGGQGLSRSRSGGEETSSPGRVDGIDFRA